MRRRGFSLIEIMVVMGITVLLLGIGMVNYRGGARKASPQSLANALVAEFQAARMRALQAHTFVALEFPSSGQGCCQSFSRWEGTSKARYVKGRNFAQEFAGSSIFLGHWPLSSGSFTTNRLPNGLEIPGFTLSTLFNPMPTSYLLVFTPTGGVLSNDLPMLDGRYQIVVGASMTCASGSAPSGTPSVSPRPPYFTLQGLSQPQRIEIDTTGGVTVRTDLGPSSGVNVQANAGGSAPGAAAAAPAGGANQTPQVESIVLSPGAPNLPSTVEGAISKEDYLRLTVEATDTDGDPLLCDWVSHNGGAFTTSGPTRMRWDQVKKRYFSTWTFRANPADTPGFRYDLECRVTDPQGTPATAAAGVTLTQNVEVRVKPFFAASEWPHKSLYVCNVDGSDLHTVPAPGMLPAFISCHPDGKTIAFTDTNYTTNEFHIWSVNKDGSGLRRLTSATSQAACGSYSPDGKSYAFCRGGGLQIMPACGEVDPTPAAAALLPPVPRMVPGGFTSWNNLRWSPDSKKIVVTGRINAQADEQLFTFDTSTNTWASLNLPPIARALVPNAVMYQAAYARDPAFNDQLVVIYYAGPNWRMCQMNDDGTNIRQVAEPTGTGWLGCPTVTRDSKGLMYQSGSQIVYVDYDFATATATNPQVVHSGSINEIDPW